MNKISDKNKRLIMICSLIAIIIIVIATVIILAIRYNVEGETNLPFEITSLKIISTAQGDNQLDTENKWNLNIIQKNDFYFYIEKNPNYQKDVSISKITFENFNIEKTLDKGIVNIYKPTTNSILYNYTDDYKIENTLSYNGALSTNIPSLEISNQGGLIGFSIALKDLGNYITNEDTEIVHDGTILSKIGLTNEDILMKISFDMIIETSSNNKFKSTLSFDLPTGNIVEEGLSIINKENPNDIIFKRF